MARLIDMTLQYLENLLVQNPGVTLFTGVFFSDIAANSDSGNIFPATSQPTGNPSRNQVKNAYQAAVDKAKYLAAVQIPVVYPDASTNSLGGTLVTSGNQAVGNSSANSGLPNQVPQNAVTTTQASIAPKVAVAASADDNIQEGVLAKPPAYVQRIQLNADVVNSN